MRNLFLVLAVCLCLSSVAVFADDYYNRPAVDKFESSTQVDVKLSPLAQLTELAVKGKRSGVKQKKQNQYKVKKRQIEEDYKTKSSWF